MITERQKQVVAFTKHGLPGMTLAALPTSHYRVVLRARAAKKCESCDQTISHNKLRCGMCQQLIWRELAEQIGEDRDLFDTMLDRNCPTKLDRVEMTRNLKPYLKFTV